jgi:RpiB/LacA/LacB family sugar-phosphate isomerase
MNVVIACDHAGFPLKAVVREEVLAAGHKVTDVGTNNPEPVDYPDYALTAGKAVAEKRADRAIVVCGSGVGACIAANKIFGVYAGVCHDSYSAHQAVEHDDMNVLCLGARIIGSEVARELVRVFLSAKFSGEERHLRRVKKIRKIESSYMEKNER